MQTEMKFCCKNLACALLILTAALTLSAQQDADPNQLAIKTSVLPKAFPRQLYQIQLEPRGGTPPYSLKITGGSLPTGIALGPDGVISGAATAVGEFRFVV